MKPVVIAQTDQQRAVTASLLALSYWNFHSGSRVPSWSRNSSEASSKYLKSGDTQETNTHKEETDSTDSLTSLAAAAAAGQIIQINLSNESSVTKWKKKGTYPGRCRQMCSGWPCAPQSLPPLTLYWCHHSVRGEREQIISLKTLLHWYTSEMTAHFSLSENSGFIYGLGNVTTLSVDHRTPCRCSSKESLVSLYNMNYRYGKCIRISVTTLLKSTVSKMIIILIEQQFSLILYNVDILCNIGKSEHEHDFFQ